MCRTVGVEWGSVPRVGSRSDPEIRRSWYVGTLLRVDIEPQEGSGHTQRSHSTPNKGPSDTQGSSGLTTERVGKNRTVRGRHRDTGCGSRRGNVGAQWTCATSRWSSPVSSGPSSRSSWHTRRPTDTRGSCTRRHRNRTRCTGCGRRTCRVVGPSGTRCGPCGSSSFHVGPKALSMSDPPPPRSHVLTRGP